MADSDSKHIILAVINDLAGDQRIHRIASTLSQAGYRVTVVGRLLPTSKPLSERPYQTHRFRLALHTGKLFYLLFNIRLFFWLLAQPVDIITANDLDTLLACFMASKLKRKRLIYDSHELFTEVPELIHRPASRKVWLALEQWLVPKLTTACTVNQSLARIFSEKYNVPFTAIRNVPFRKEGAPKTKGEKIILYQGALNLGRGIDLMIDSMKHLPDYRLWIVGRGDVEKVLRQQAESFPKDQIVFHGFTPLEKLAELTAKAGIGLSLEEDMGANYHYASPNKVYDYLQARIPVIVADLPEMSALVEEYTCGLILKTQERTAEELAAKINYIFEAPGLWESFSQAAHIAAETLIWENEQQLLLDLYRS